MKTIIICFTIIYFTIAQLCAQNDTLTQILEDIQEEDESLNNWLEILSEQIIDPDKSSIKMYPKISFAHRIQYTLEENRAVANNIFMGSPFESYTKLRINLYDNLSAGALIQKDVGEKSYFDHYSGFISWNHPFQPYKIILGNYNIGCAEGLLLSGPFSLPKAATIKKPSSNRYLISRPFLSSNEYDGFWGGVLEVGNIHGWKVIAYYSQVFRDGIPSDDNNGITGFDRTGYHRTLTENARANRIIEKSYGGVLSIPTLFLDRFGIIFVRTHYSPKIIKSLLPDERRRNYFNFYGARSENFSFFCLKNFHTIRFSSEIAPLKSKKISYISTLNFTPPDWQFVCKTWYIPSQFQSPYGRIPSDSNPFPQSVQGFMFGATGKAFRELKIIMYWSYKNNLWRSYFQPLPVQKKEFYIQSEYRLGIKKYLTFRYSNLFSDYYSSGNQEKTEIFKQSFRIQIQQHFSSKVRFQTRLEKVFLNFSPYQASKKGTNIYQDISWNICKPLTLRIRFSAFNTNDYDSRIYEYENDLPTVFSNYPLYGRGRKWYAMVIFKPAFKMIFRLKFRRIFYDDVKTIGSGLTSIAGDMRQDIHLQLDFQY